MHIPATMLSGVVCPVTTAVSGAGIAAAAYFARKSDEKPSSWKFAAVTALIFALQMLNYPVQSGTSGHLVGAMLAVGFLGIPFAILSMSIVLGVQTFFFADGGVNALGANILNMAILGAGLGGWLYQKALSKNIPQKLSLGSAAFLSVLIGAAACSFQIALSGTAALSKALPAMLSVHALIGFGEGLITVAVVSLLQTYQKTFQANEQRFAWGALGLAVLAALASPLASGFPDGLEWVAQKLAFVEFNGFEISAMFPDYQATFVMNPAAATILAGIIGVLLSFGLTLAVGQSLQFSRTKTL